MSSSALTGDQSWPRRSSSASRVRSASQGRSGRDAASCRRTCTESAVPRRARTRGTVSRQCRACSSRPTNPDDQDSPPAWWGQYRARSSQSSPSSPAVRWSVSWPGSLARSRRTSRKRPGAAPSWSASPAPQARVAGGQAGRGGPAGLKRRLARSWRRGPGDEGLGGRDTGGVAVPGEDLGQDGEGAPQRAELLVAPLLPALAWRRAAGGHEPGKGGGRAVQAARQRRGELAVVGSVERLQAVGPCPGCQVPFDESPGEARQAADAVRPGGRADLPRDPGPAGCPRRPW